VYTYRCVPSYVLLSLPYSLLNTFPTPHQSRHAAQIYTATHCNSTKHTATHCNTLQHIFPTPDQNRHPTQIFLCVCVCMSKQTCDTDVATISRLLTIIGLFCKRTLLKRLSYAKETYDFEEPTNRSHPIASAVYTHMSLHVYMYIHIHIYTYTHTDLYK